MHEGSTRPESVPLQSALPRRVVVASGIVAIALSIGLGWVLLRLAEELPETQRRALRVQDLVGRIDYLDEGLTASVRLYVLSRDERYAERYSALESHLFHAIDSLRTNLPATAEWTPDSLLAVAGELAALEHRAIELARAGDVEQAYQVVSGPRYQAAKRSYLDARDAVLLDLHRWVGRETDSMHDRLRGLALLGISSLLVLGLTWALAARLVHDHLQRRKRAESVLEAQRAYFESLFEGSPAAIALGDESDRILRVNEAFTRLFGFTSEEAVGHTSQGLIVPPELADEAREINRSMARGTTISTEAVRVRKDGSEVAVSILATPLDLGGGVQRVYCIYRDIGPERAAREALVASEQRYRSLVYNNPNAVFELNLEGRIALANPASERISGYPVAELVGRYFLDLVDPGAREDAAEVFAVASSGESRPFELEMPRRDGNTILLRGIAVPVIVDGRVTGVFGIGEDVTRQQEVEERLRHAEKLEAVGRLAGGIAHDFNNLLTAIGGYAQLLAQELADDSPARADIDEIQRSAERGASLTRELLAFSRKQFLEPTALDLNQVLSRMYRMIERAVGEDVDVELRPEPGLGCVEADPGQIEQVILNLTMNARDAMSRGGQLVFETRNRELSGRDEDHADSPLPPGRYVMLSVEDSGTGMDASALEHAFEPFFTTKEPGRGTGLGLATVYGIVKQSGGEIRIDSKVGRGTRFDILLPRVEKPSATPVAPPPVELEVTGNEVVLVVEDDPSVRTIVVRTLDRAGYRVIAPNRPSEALRLLETEPADLLITDLIMPDVDGIAIADHAKSVRPRLPILFMTGYAEQELLRRGIERPGNNLLLRKPFRPTELLARVQQLLSRRQ